MNILLLAPIWCTLAHDNLGFDQDRLNLIPARMQKFVDEKEIAGTVVLVRRRGKPALSAATGFARLGPNTAMKPDTIFQIMSMTKPITAVAVVICAERGLLNLDDSVDRFIPALDGLMVVQPDGTLAKRQSRITIRHLLTHTSGFPSIDPAGLSDEAKAKLTLKEYADLLPQSRLIAEPGTKISYSGPGITLAGRIVEIVSGQPLEKFLHDNVFAPLEMKDTAFFSNDSMRPRLAHMYYAEKGKLQELEGDPMRPGAKLANPAGGLYSTAADVANFMECIANQGSRNGKRILSPLAVATMTTLQTGELLSDGNDAQGYGLGFSVVRSMRGSSQLKSVGVFGHTGAFGTEFWADSRTGVVSVFMSQSFSDRVRKTFTTMVNAAFIGP